MHILELKVASNVSKDLYKEYTVFWNSKPSSQNYRTFLSMYLGTAFEKICVAMVRPSSPWEIDLFGKGEIIYNENLDYIGCYLTTCEKTINCMSSLVLEKVYKIVENYVRYECSNS